MKTGELRDSLWEALQSTLAGDMEPARAQAVASLGKAITQSLYLETRVALFTPHFLEENHKLGSLPASGLIEAGTEEAGL